MLILLKTIGVLFILMGILFMLKPAFIRNAWKFFSLGKRIYWAGLIRFVLAIVFFFAASKAQRPWMVIAIGILLLLGGILCFTIKQEKIQKIFAWWLKKPDTILRLLSIVLLAFGALIIYSA